jgi:hypothetical protein
MARTKRTKHGLTKAQSKKKAVLDAVLRQTLDIIRKEPVTLYDAAIWLLYACTRGDAKETALDMARYPDENDPNYAPADEIDGMIDCARDDFDTASGIWEDQRALAQELDPGYKLPILNQVDWL